MLWALLVEYVGGGSMAAPVEVEGVLLGQTALASTPAAAAAPTLDTWGTSQEARDGEAAMKALLG